MDKNNARRRIQELVAKYEEVKRAGDINKYTEQDTKDSFIRPMFEALGWNFYDRKEVTKEEDMSGGRVDYGIYVNSQPKLFIEAKKLGVNLHNPEYAEQAIRYCFNRVVTWAVLTDFESIKVFNAQNVSENLSNKLYFEIPYSEYIDRFDQLCQLSKESFETGYIDKEATRVGKLQQKITVTEQLAKDLNEIRDMLTQNLHQWNPEVSPFDLDEGVQKLLDRLIFLRVAEDRGIEEAILKQLIREFPNRKDKSQHIYQTMITKFRELDEIYNSGLFSPHPFENWQEYSGVTEKAINILYGKSGYYEYDFKFIPSDVLGQVYENYLGHLLNKSRKGLTLDLSAKKRKEQGIYYTPSYIEDYIVEQALKPVLDNCRSVAELKAIKVLDPACGSGSFLIKAMEMIEKKYVEFGARKGEGIRLQILLDNIYGVDLDEKAVEIARLNLVINSLETRMKLPGLEQHIKNGNSLIAGTEEELKKYFGKNYHDKKPFNWEEEFPEVFNRPNPGFDVIIGNPPWVFTRGENLSESEKLYFDNYLSETKVIQGSKGKNIQSGKFNLYALFLIMSIQITRTDGHISFVIPNNILRTTSYDSIRKYILEAVTINEITDLGDKIFSGVTAASIILHLGKKLPSTEHKVRIITDTEDLINKKYITNNITQEDFKKNTSFAFSIFADTDSSILNKKIMDESVSLGSLADYIIEGIVGSLKSDVAKEQINQNYKPLLLGKDIGRYFIKFNNRWINYDRKILHRARPEEVFLSEKILIQRISGGLNPITATLDKNKYYAFASLNCVVLKQSSPYNINFILAMLNSKLINWYYSTNFSNKSNLTVNVSKTYLEKLPIKRVTITEQKRVIILVKQILDLHAKRLLTPENSNKWQQIKLEIERTNRQIDELVFQLYDLTEEEINFVKEK